MAIQNVSMLSGDHNAELESINRNRQLAMMLQNQSLQPMEQQQPGVLSSPTQGLAKMLKMYAAKQQMDKADERQRELTTGMNQKLADGLQNYSKTLQGTPATEGTPAMPERPYSPEQGPMPLQATPSMTQQPIMQPQQEAVPGQPAVPGDRQAALSEALRSGHPVLSQFALQEMAAEPDRQLRAQQMEQMREDRRLAREQSDEQFELTRADRLQNWENQEKLRRDIASSGAGQSPYFQPVQTGEGVFAFNARTGTVEPVRGANGRPIIGAQADPSLQGRIAGAKASGKEMGESSAKSQINLPQAIDTAEMAIKQIDDLISHPGFSSSVGATLRPFANKLDGTPEADFTKRLDQLKGGAFLNAFESLKGGGQITEVEGKKATDAITRMDKAQSETEFANAAREFQGVIRQGINRAKVKAGGAPARPEVSIDDLLNKYK